MKEGLGIIKQRAINENVMYVETMLSRVGINSSDYFNANEIKTVNDQLKHSSEKELIGILSNIFYKITKSPNNVFDRQVEMFRC